MFSEVLQMIRSEYPEIEIRNFDYNVLDKASSLIVEIYNKLSFICQSKKYSFDYYFVFRLNFEKRFITAHVSAYVGKKMNTYIIEWVLDVEYPVIKPESVSLFIWIYEKQLKYNKCQDLEKAKRLFKEVSDRENLKFHISRDPRADSNVYALEIPVKANVLEYNAI
jgi:hypothetical protein